MLGLVDIKCLYLKSNTLPFPSVMPISLSLKIILLTRNQALKLISFLSLEIFLNSVGKQFRSVQPTISVNFHFSFPFLPQPSWFGSVHLYLSSCQNLFIDLSFPSLLQYILNIDCPTVLDGRNSAAEAGQSIRCW